MFILIIFSVNLALCAVQAPNYDFSLKTFEPLLPGNKFETIKTLYPKYVLSKVDQKTKTYKLMVSQLRYLFPVYLQVQEDVVIDFYARLPQYFLHDIFHQSLINKLGPQDKYKRIDEHAIYVWNKDDTVHTYEGACTITCFTLYYSVYAKNKNFEPLIKSMNAQASKASKQNP